MILAISGLSKDLVICCCPHGMAQYNLVPAVPPLTVSYTHYTQYSDTSMWIHYPQDNPFPSKQILVYTRSEHTKGHQPVCGLELDTSRFLTWHLITECTASCQHYLLEHQLGRYTYFTFPCIGLFRCTENVCHIYVCLVRWSGLAGVRMIHSFKWLSD